MAGFPPGEFMPLLFVKGELLSVRMFRSLALATVAAAVALAGCTAGADPKQTVDEALKAVGNQQQATVTVKVDTTSDDLNKLVQASQSGSSQSDAATASVLRLIPKLSITSATRAREGTLQQATTLDKMDFAVKLAVGDKPVEFVVVNGKGFLRADVDGIGQESGLFTGMQVRLMLDSLPDAKSWMTDLVDGKWMQLDEGSMATLIAQATQAQATASPQAVNPAAFADLLSKNSQVTKVDDTTFKVVTDAKGLIQGMADASPDDQFTNEQAAEAIGKLNEGANLDTTLTIESGKVTRATFDIADVLRTWFKPEEGAEGDATRRIQAAEFKLNAVMELSDRAEIAEPTGATTIPAADIEQLMKSFNPPR